MNIIQELEKEQVEEMVAKRPIPEFDSGDTLRVNVRVVEGNRTRTQAFEGVCIARKNRGVNSAFTVRKLSYGEGVERIFPLYSPVIESIEVLRRGDVRRAKLYYLRGRTGKAARIAEKTTGYSAKVESAIRAERQAAASAAKAAQRKKQEEAAAQKAAAAKAEAEAPAAESGEES